MPVSQVDDEALVRMRAEFIEMPGLRLTVRQAQRLMGLEPCACEQAIESLLAVKFLRRLPDGTFVRGESH